MILKIRINKKEIEIQAVPDDCSFHTILKEYPEKEEELQTYDMSFWVNGTEKIRGRSNTENIYFNGTLTTKNIIFAENCPKNIIGWHQLKDMGLLKVDMNRKHVVDVPPVLIDCDAKIGYDGEEYLKKHLIGDAKRVIASWVRKGIIERCISDCNSSVTLGTKSNGKVKIRFHYHNLNESASKEPMEGEINRHNVIASVPLGTFYSVIRLYYGEWQIHLDTHTKHRTAFTFLGKQYVWNRLPGKFKNTPAILSNTLGQILDKLPQNVRKHVIYYIDRILISANNKKESRYFTNLVWDHLEDNGFEMQETDNQICQPQVEYLGRKITPEGIGLGETYLQKVREITTPRSAAELWSILSTLEDARRFTPGFGIFADVLYKIRNKKENWFWEERHEKALHDLKRQILKNRFVVPALAEEDTCIVQIFVLDDAWMAEVSNSARMPYRSESGVFQPVKTLQKKAVRELKAMKIAWGKIESQLNGRDIVWEVECPEVADYVKDPSSLEVAKNLAESLTFLFSPQHKIKVIESSGRKLPI